MSKARILLFTTTDTLSGVAQHTHAVALGLRAADYDVALALRREASPLLDAQRAAGIRHLWLARDPYASVNDFVNDRELPRALFAAERPDLVVFASGIHPLTIYSALHAATRARLPTLIYEGGVRPRLLREAEPHLDVLAGYYRRAGAVITVSRHDLATLRATLGLGPEVGQVIAAGRPPKFFAAPEPARRLRLRGALGLAEVACPRLVVQRLS